MLQIEKILFPVDFTENSTKILPYVLSMAEKYGSTIYKGKRPISCNGYWTY